jgi:cellulose synthase (UDP-forming)
MNTTTERALTVLLFAVTIAASLLAAVDILSVTPELVRADDWTGAGALLAFAVIAGILNYGFFVYFLTRLGYLERFSRHVPATRHALETYATNAPSLAVLVPAYKEEMAVVRRTLLSAALLEYPQRRVVLLIDDPPCPASAADAAALAAMRRLPGDLAELFAAPARRGRLLALDFATRRAQGSFDPHGEALLLAGHYAWAADWFDEQIGNYRIRDHEDRLFVTRVLAHCRDAHRARAAELERSAGDSRLDQRSANDEYMRLQALFAVEFSSFERKRYENLSHEANKAMNLNSYLALMGRSFREFAGPGREGLLLRESAPGPDTLDVPDADLIVTLDADSVLLPDYALRLAHVLAEPGNERVAVAQTPYSAFPGAPGMLERTAGATTDIQYIIHQGFTRYNATFWVGANALLRKAALEDICTEHVERGYRVRKYIQDRTVIEDTESSIDLASRGWTLFNYPERLAYSATPSDFGALLIQRRRWANGGLIILPKALRCLFSGPRSRQKLAEGFCRVHYLTSIAGINLASLLLLFGPFSRNTDIAWLALCGIPYIYAYARDLVLCGYRWSDFPRVWALNLLLLPVHLGGVLKSVQQAVTGRKTPFARTPKIAGRTAAPALYVLATYAFVLASLIMLGIRVSDGAWFSAGFALACAAGNAYALVRFIGWRESFIDLRLRRSTEASVPDLPITAVAD